MSIDIAKARQLIEEFGTEQTYRENTDELAAMMPAALDRIEQLQAALVEACDITDELLNGCEVDETLDAKRIDELRALAAGEVTP